MVKKTWPLYFLMLGSVFIFSGENNAEAKSWPRPTATPTPKPTAAPTPAPTPAPSCITITAPAGGATVSGSTIAISTSDTCSGNWFESLFVDGVHVSDFTPGGVIFNSITVSNGTHTIQVTSQSANPGSIVLGSASVTLKVSNSTAASSNISFTLPTSGSTISGTVAFAVQASTTAAGTPWVRFCRDPKTSGQCSANGSISIGDTASMSLAQDTTPYGNGTHVIQADSFVSSGSTSTYLTSTQENVLVSNLPTSTSLTILSPTNNQTISGTVTITISLNQSDPNACYACWAVDGVHQSCTPAIGPWSWDTTALSSGFHSLLVTASSCAGATNYQASVAVNVQNSGATPSPTPSSSPSSSYFSTQLVGSSLPSDAQCAASITKTSETIANVLDPNFGFNTSNTNFNANVPTSSQLSSFAAGGFSFDPLTDTTQFQRITGAYPQVLGATPSTDMILRFASCKYGIDEDVARGQAWQESYWRQGIAGDKQTSSSSCVQGNFTSLYNQAIAEPDGNTVPQVSGGCYQSWSLLQTKAFYEWMTWPMIMQSTNFAAEYRYATQRECMNGAYVNYFGGTSGQYWQDYLAYQSNPNGANSSAPNYYPGLANEPSFAQTNANRMLWGCIGTHYAGYSWYGATDAVPYIQDIQGNIACKRWRTPTTYVSGACSSPTTAGPGF